MWSYDDIWSRDWCPLWRLPRHSTDRPWMFADIRLDAMLMP